MFQIKRLFLTNQSALFQHSATMFHYNMFMTLTQCLTVSTALIKCCFKRKNLLNLRLADLLKRNKRAGVELEALAEAMSQLAKIGQELMRPEDDRDPMWRSIPVAKEIMVSKGIATRAPWENIEVNDSVHQASIRPPMG